jgi:hypothetical protein
MMTRYTVEMLVVQGNVTTYLDVPVTPDGAPNTTSKEQALKAARYWRASHPSFQFQITEWTPKLVQE